MCDQYTADSDQIECEGLFDSFGNLQPNVGFVRRCIINAAFEEIEEYDIYRFVW